MQLRTVSRTCAGPRWRAGASHMSSHETAVPTATAQEISSTQFVTLNCNTTASRPTRNTTVNSRQLDSRGEAALRPRRGPWCGTPPTARTSCICRCRASRHIYCISGRFFFCSVLANIVSRSSLTRPIVFYIHCISLYMY